jgi:hypothetical protein
MLAGSVHAHGRSIEMLELRLGEETIGWSPVLALDSGGVKFGFSCKVALPWQRPVRMRLVVWSDFTPFAAADLILGPE